jgi:hypothetical protein
VTRQEPVGARAALIGASRRRGWCRQPRGSTDSVRGVGRPVHDDRDLSVELGSLPSGTLDLDRSPQSLNPVVEPDQAGASARILASDSVIANREVEGVFGRVYRHPHARGSGVVRRSPNRSSHGQHPGASSEGLDRGIIVIFAVVVIGVFMSNRDGTISRRAPRSRPRSGARQGAPPVAATKPRSSSTVLATAYATGGCELNRVRPAGVNSYTFGLTCSHGRPARWRRARSARPPRPSAGLRIGVVGLPYASIRLAGTARAV